MKSLILKRWFLVYVLSNFMTLFLQEVNPDQSLQLSKIIKSGDVDLIYRKSARHQLTEPPDIELFLNTLDRLLKDCPVRDDSGFNARDKPWPTSTTHKFNQFWNVPKIVLKIFLIIVIFWKKKQEFRKDYLIQYRKQYIQTAKEYFVIL